MLIPTIIWQAFVGQKIIFHGIAHSTLFTNVATMNHTKQTTIAHNWRPSQVKFTMNENQRLQSILVV